MTEDELTKIERRAGLREPDDDLAEEVLSLVAEVRRLREQLSVFAQNHVLEQHPIQVGETVDLGDRFETKVVAPFRVRLRTLEDAARAEREACIHAVVQYHARDIPHGEPGCQCYEIEQLLARGED